MEECSRHSSKKNVSYYQSGIHKNLAFYYSLWHAGDLNWLKLRWRPWASSFSRRTVSLHSRSPWKAVNSQPAIFPRPFQHHQGLDATRLISTRREINERELHAQSAQQHPALNVSSAPVNARFLRRVGKLAQLLAIILVLYGGRSTHRLDATKKRKKHVFIRYKSERWITN